MLVAHLAVSSGDPADSSRVDDVHEQKSPFHQETLEAEPVPHRREPDLASVREAEGYPKAQRVLPMGHDREFGRGIVCEERQSTRDVLEGVAGAVFADDGLLWHIVFDEPLFHQDARGNRLLFRRKVDPASHDDCVVTASLPEREAADEALFGQRARQSILRCHFACRNEQVAHGLASF